VTRNVRSHGVLNFNTTPSVQPPASGTDVVTVVLLNKRKQVTQPYHTVHGGNVTHLVSVTVARGASS
jgi:hypothetical protein